MPKTKNKTKAAKHLVERQEQRVMAVDEENEALANDARLVRADAEEEAFLHFAWVADTFAAGLPLRLDCPDCRADLKLIEGFRATRRSEALAQAIRHADSLDHEVIGLANTVITTQEAGRDLRYLTRRLCTLLREAVCDDEAQK